MKVSVATFCGNKLYVGRSVSSSETSRDVPENGSFHNHGRENLKCCTGQSFPTRDIECNTDHLGVQYVPCWRNSFVRRFMQLERRRE